MIGARTNLFFYCQLYCQLYCQHSLSMGVDRALFSRDARFGDEGTKPAQLETVMVPEKRAATAQSHVGMAERVA